MGGLHARHPEGIFRNVRLVDGLGLGAFLRGLLTARDIGPIWVIVVMMRIVMVLGTFLDWIAIIFIPCRSLPRLSPPLGPACFLLKPVAPTEIELHGIFRAVLPFIALPAVGMFLVLAFPELALWLPRMLE